MAVPTTLTVILRDPHADASAVRDWFAQQGFDVAPTVVDGGSFAITAPPDRARAVFADLPTAGGELPLDRVPAAVAAQLSAVVAEPPLDFGPPSW